MGRHQYGREGGTMGEFLRRFCGLMGSHFGALGDKEEEKKEKQTTESQSMITQVALQGLPQTPSN